MDQERDFTREPIGRFEWERILRRIQVSAPSVKLVGFTMATYADANGGRVRPGQSRLAAVMGTSISTVRRGQSELETIGMLDMVVKGRSFGRGHVGSFASEYRLSVPSDLLAAIPMLDPDEQNYGAPTTGTSENNRAPVTPSSEEQPVISEELPVISEELPVIWVEEPVTHERPPQHEHHNKDQNKEHQSLAVAQADAQACEPQQGEIEIDLPVEELPLSKAALTKQLGEDFNDWYAIYPKRVGRGAAVNSYAKARKNGATSDDLPNGAMSYAVERKGQDPQFTKAPATWLNQECWADERASPAVLSPWDPAYHRNGKLTTSQKMRNTVEAGRRLQAEYDARNGIAVPRQYQWCNPPRELESPEEESA